MINLYLSQVKLYITQLSDLYYVDWHVEQLIQKHDNLTNKIEELFRSILSEAQTLKLLLPLKSEAEETVIKNIFIEIKDTALEFNDIDKKLLHLEHELLNKKTRGRNIGINRIILKLIFIILKIKIIKIWKILKNIFGKPNRK